MSVTETHAPQGGLTVKAPGALTGDRGIYIVLALFAALVVTITATFGLPGLAMTALAMVPVIFTALILITVGK